MIAKDLINPLIPHASPTDDFGKLTVLMDDFRVNHLPVVEDSTSVFRGFISNEMLYEQDSPHNNGALATYELSTENCTVYEDQHFYEILKAMTECNSEMIAVLSHEDIFLGVITVGELLQAFSKTIAVQSPGGIIVASIKKIDYSLAEITRLIEADGAKVIGCYLLDDDENTDSLKITLKLDKKDVSHIVATLERFNYQIVSLFQEEKIISNEKERLDILMKYLNI
jgi:predicted transcriptional regulator